MRTKGFSDTSIDKNFQLLLRGTNYQLIFYYLNATVNFILTLAIGMPQSLILFQFLRFCQAGRIWWLRRQIIALMGHSRHSRVVNDKYMAIVAMLYVYLVPSTCLASIFFRRLECGIAYPISLIAHATIEGNVDKILIPVNLTPLTIQLAVCGPGFLIYILSYLFCQGIAPTLIMVCACLGKSITEEIINAQSTSCTLQYSDHDGSKDLSGLTSHGNTPMTSHFQLEIQGPNKLEV